MTLREWALTLRAIPIVLMDSNRTDEIQRVEETTSKKRMHEELAMLQSTDEGKHLLARRPELNAKQVDYDSLRRLPAHTLGGAYIRHLDDNGLSADSQATPTRHVDDPDIAYLIRRFRQTHDVWHPLTALGTTGWEEVTIHAFSYGQLRLPVSAMVVYFGGIKHGLLERRWRMLRHTLLDAYRKGRNARPLLRVTWEDQWKEPLADVRRRYGIEPVSA